MSAGSVKTVGTELECTQCGNVAPIQRKKGKQREKGHTKHMYCWKCKDTTAHTEVKEDAFLPDWWKEVNEG